jgi:hypothetical protein
MYVALLHCCAVYFYPYVQYCQAHVYVCVYVSVFKCNKCNFDFIHYFLLFAYHIENMIHHYFCPRSHYSTVIDHVFASCGRQNAANFRGGSTYW